jgi:hypothetical protein
MELATGAYGNGLARYFRADASSHLVTRTLRKSKLAVTRIRRDTPGHGLTSPVPPEPAFSVLLQLRDSPTRELFIGGRSAAFDQDAIDNRASLARGRLQMPVLAIGGDHSFGATMAFVMRFAADDVRQVVITDSGHWLMEEQPQATIAAIRAFLDSSATLAQARRTSAEVDALPREGAGAGTSGLSGIQTTILSGNPNVPGPYAFEIRVPAHTRIAAHSHRDNRTALVVSGEWHFGYGELANEAASKTLGPGGFYTEPAGQPHFAFTGDLPTVVYITGQGPTDTIYVVPADAPSNK